MKRLYFLIFIVFIYSCSQQTLEKEQLVFDKNIPTDSEPNESDSEDDNEAPPTEDPTPPGDPYETPVQIKFSWNAPQFRQNCDPLTIDEIQGYRFYFGFQEDVWENPVELNNNLANSYSFNVDADDVYNFALTTLDTMGNESKKSETIKVTCTNGNCVVTAKPEPAEPACQNQDIAVKEQGVKVKIQKAVQRKKVAAQEVCPNFPLNNRKDPKIFYRANNIRVTPTSYSPTVIQCNWSRHAQTNPNKENIQGLSKLKLHLPIYRSGQAFIVKDNIYIPYDLTSMSIEQKRNLAKKLGAREGANLSKAFIELPYNSTSTFPRNYSVSFNENNISSGFAVINDSTYASMAIASIPICEDKQEDDDSAEEECYEQQFVLKNNLEKSSYLARSLNIGRIPTIKLAFEKGSDIEGYLKIINDPNNKLEIFQRANGIAKVDKYISYDFKESQSSKRLNYSETKIVQKSRLDILRNILKFKHKNMSFQVVNYANSLLSSSKNLSPQVLNQKIPNLRDFLVNLYEKIKDDKEVDTYQKANCLKLIDTLYTDINTNPLGKVAKEFHKLLSLKSIGHQTAYKYALRFMDYDNALTNTVYDIYQSIESTVTISSLSKLELTTDWVAERKLKKDHILRIFNAATKIIKKIRPNAMPDDYFYENILPERNLLISLENLYQEKDVKEMQLNLMSTLMKRLMPTVRSLETDYYDDYPSEIISPKYFDVMFTEVVELVFERKIKEEQVNLYINLLDFLYSKKFVMMYSFNDALKVTKKLIFEDEITISDFYRIKSNYTFWTSRSETFLSDRSRAFNLALKTQVGDEKEKYQTLQRLYHAYRENNYRGDQTLKEKRQILNYSYKKVISENTSEVMLEIEIKAASWLSQNFYEEFTFPKTNRKVIRYIERYALTSDKLQKLQEAYQKYLKESDTKLKALRKAEREVLPLTANDETSED